MRKHKLQLILLMFLGLVMAGLAIPTTAQAATMADVMSGTGNSFNKMIGNVVFGNSGGGLSLYPSLTAITANNTSNNRITTATTQVKITFDGTITGRGGGKINGLYYDLMNSDGTSVQTGTHTIVVNNTNSTTLNSKSVTLTVDLSDLRDRLPLIVGFRYNSSDGEVAYGFGTLGSNSTVADALNPTIDDGLTGTSTKITGTGTAGDTISSDVNSVTTTVGSDGKYSLDLGQAIGSATTVKITESNATGDSKSVTGDVKQKTLDITSKTTDVSMQPDDLVAVDKMTSDDEVIKWLVDQTGISATPSDGSDDTVTYANDDTGLVDKLKALGDNESTTINIYGKDGDLKSDSVAVTVTNHLGTLSFGSLSSSISYGSMEVPAKETLFAPTSNWDVSIKDTRATGSQWTLTASATAMTSTSGHTIPGGLVYRDGDTKTNLTDNATTIDTGTKAASVESTTVTDDWSATKGIFLDAQPSVYADTYNGTVNWSLQDTP
ncbi:cell surface protein [Lactiplantibacillus fabifermentans T30PCM01]|uniref:Cell surface protein n=1 Tax=Lactiplantibacillus fabifermentans T30PCM01 TaxID=1400520 RepID=W6T589_9LACO|nr:hypothetical protein [Lactiplantibacillus fabifermentans]ETY73261.1 cell surface protein [Lactiplantibacillus fabifermentans T30PCM01]